MGMQVDDVFMTQEEFDGLPKYAEGSTDSPHPLKPGMKFLRHAMNNWILVETFSSQDGSIRTLKRRVILSRISGKSDTEGENSGDLSFSQ